MPPGLLLTDSGTHDSPHKLSDDEFGLIVGDDGTFVVLTSDPGRPLSERQMAILSAAVHAARDPVYAQDALYWWGLATRPAAGSG